MSSAGYKVGDWVLIRRLRAGEKSGFLMMYGGCMGRVTRIYEGWYEVFLRVKDVYVRTRAWEIEKRVVFIISSEKG